MGPYMRNMWTWHRHNFLEKRELKLVEKADYYLDANLTIANLEQHETGMNDAWSYRNLVIEKQNQVGKTRNKEC